MSSPSATRILIVDDHEVVRVGLRSLLESYPDFVVIGEAEGCKDGLELAGLLQPDLILLDLRLRDGNGCDICPDLQLITPKTKIVILTSYLNERSLLDAMNVGADGYVLKEVEGIILANSIRQVMKGGSAYDPAMVKRVLHRSDALKTNQEELTLIRESLSAREWRMLHSISLGRTNRQIAQDIGLNENTLKNAVSTLMAKLKVARRTEAAGFFVKYLARHYETDVSLTDRAGENLSAQD